MRLSLRPATSHSVVHVDADGVAAAARVLTTLNAPTYAPLPTPKPTWSLASFALRALAGSLDALELDMADAPTLGLTPRADVLDDLLPADEEREEDPRVWAALALAYGLGSTGAPRRMPLSDPHLFALPQPVVLDFSAPGMQTPFGDGAAVNLLAADLRALVLLDLSGQTGLTDRGLKALARAQGTRGLRALALRGCVGVGVEGVTACALAWERLEVLDIRGTRCPKGTAIPGFAPRPPALLAESHFHPRSPEQVARALLGKDTPFILVDEEDFGRPARRRPVLDRPRLVRERAPPSVTAVSAPRVFTTSMPEPGVLLVEPPPPPPPAPPEQSLPPEPTTMAELRARRLEAFGVAPPVPPPAPLPISVSTPAPRPTAPAQPSAAQSVWTRAPTASNPLWNDLLARHPPRPRPPPRLDMAVPQHIRAAARAPARARSPSPSHSSSRSRSPSPNPWALPSFSSPSPSPSRSPSPPPAKRPRLSNPYSNSNSNASGSKRKPRASKAERETKRAIQANEAERARFAARLSDEGALMFVRVGPPPASTPVQEKRQVEERVEVKIRSSADLRAHLAGVMGRRGPGPSGSGTGAQAGAAASAAGAGAGAGSGAGASASAVGSGAGAGSSASTAGAVASASAVGAGAGAGASAAAPVARRVPFAKAASAGKRGLSTWHDVPPDEEEDDEDEVVEVPRPPLKSRTLGSKMQPTGVKPAAKAITLASKVAAKSTKPAAKPKIPSLNSGGGAAAARQTKLSFAKKPLSGKGKG